MFNLAIQPLEWDSRHFAIKVGRYLPSVISEDVEVLFLTEFRKRGYDCVYVALDPNDVDSAQVAARNGFFLADVRMRYVLKPDPRPQDRPTAHRTSRESQGENRSQDWTRLEFMDDSKNPSHVARVRELSRKLAVFSRFYFDPRFRGSVVPMYDIWAGNLMARDNPLVKTVVAIASGEVVGFVGNKLVDEDQGAKRSRRGELALVATDEASRGQGFGLAMSQLSIDWLFANGAEYVTVDTQGRNCKASKFYEQLGFRLQSVTLLYHVWKDALRK